MPFPRPTLSSTSHTILRGITLADSSENSHGCQASQASSTCSPPPLRRTSELWTQNGSTRSLHPSWGHADYWELRFTKPSTCARRSQKKGKRKTLVKQSCFSTAARCGITPRPQGGDQLVGPSPMVQGRNGGTTLGTAVPLQVPCSQGVPAKRQLSEEKRFRCFQTWVSGDQAHHWTISCPRSHGGSPLVSGRDSSVQQIRVEGIRQDHRPARQKGTKSARDRKNQQPRRHDHTSLMVQRARPQVLVHYHSPNRSQAQAPAVGTMAITETADALPGTSGHVWGHTLEDTGGSPEGRFTCPIGPLAIVHSTWTQDGSCSSATP